MASSFWSDSAPPDGVPIAPGHPLAVGLEALWTPAGGGRFAERVHGYDARQTNSSFPTLGQGPGGEQAWRAAVGGAASTMASPDRGALRVGGDRGFTVLVLCNPAAGASTVLSKSSAAGDEHGLEISGATFRFYYANGATYRIATSPAISPLAGAWHTVFGWHDPAADVVGVQVGHLVGTTATLGTAPLDTTSDVYLGSYRATAGRWQGLIALAAFWKRLLSPQERAELRVQPYQLFQAPAWRKYFVPAGPASGLRLLASLGVGA